MAISFYHGMPISGSGLQVIHMTRAEYERDKAALDKTDFLIDITDEDSPVISGEDIKGANNWTLASEILESRILGWTVPSNFRVHNYSNDTYFIQTVGRKKLSEFNWTKNSNILFTSTTELENAKTSGAFAAYNTVCQISRTSEQYVTAAGANVNGKTEETIKTYLDDANTYVYYELETPVQHKLWGSEITTQINSNLSELIKVKHIPVSKSIGAKTYDIFALTDLPSGYEPFSVVYKGNYGGHLNTSLGQEASSWVVNMTNCYTNALQFDGVFYLYLVKQ